MDNDDQRRNQPTVHKKYDEATALLASYALIAAGYDAICKNAQKSPFNSPSLCSLAVQNASYNTGLYGATGGQFLDINPPDNSSKTLEEVVHKKTVSLFEISFVLGWLFSGGAEGLLPVVKRAASHFGVAFQIADDLEDVEQDAQNKRTINYAALYGIKKAQEKIQDELQLFYKELTRLGVDLQEFLVLGKVLEGRG